MTERENDYVAAGLLVAILAIVAYVAWCLSA